MKAIILAAGEGIRMRPLTLKKPKPLLEVKGKPLIYHLVSVMPPEIQDLIIVVEYLGKQIVNYCGHKFLGKRVTYVWQKEKRGTFSALELCGNLLNSSERFCLFWADDIIDSKTVKNCLTHELSVVYSEVEDPRSFGVITLNTDGSIKEIIEKPENPISNLVVANGFALNKNILKYKPVMHPNGEYYLPPAVAEMAQDYKIMAVKSNLWIPLSSPEDLEKAEFIITN